LAQKRLVWHLVFCLAQKICLLDSSRVNKDKYGDQRDLLYSFNAASSFLKSKAREGKLCAILVILKTGIHPKQLKNIRKSHQQLRSLSGKNPSFASAATQMQLGKYRFSK